MFRLNFLTVLFFVVCMQTSFAANPNREFNVDKIEVPEGGIVTFDASNIRPAKKFLFNFGDGNSLTTVNSVVSYQYRSAGVFKASLTYQINANDKNPNYKEAGSVSITVKSSTPKPNQPPVARLSCSTSNLLVNCNALASTDPENQPLIFNFDYADGFSENNTTGISSHAYQAPGLYTVRLNVFDSAGASGEATTQVQAVKPPNKLPTLALNCSSSQINTLVCDAIGSADADGTIVSYTFAWDDSTSDAKAEL